MRVLNIACMIGVLVVMSACSHKPKAQGNFKSVECKTICEKNECQTKCLSADGTFK